MRVSPVDGQEDGRTVRTVRLNVVGPLDAALPSGESVLPRGRKAQAILCYLALCDELEVPRRRLVELLWSTRTLGQGQASLRQSLVQLRAALAPVPGLVVAGRDAVSLDRRAVRIEFGDEGQPLRFLETLTRLDRQFDAWIDARRTALTHRFQLRHAASLPPGRRLLLTVEPIVRLGTIGIDRFTAPALTQELVTALARCPWLGVRCSPEVADCDYRVEGYLVPRGTKVRTVLRLVDQRHRQVIVWSGEQHAAAPVLPDIMAAFADGIIAHLARGSGS